MRFLIDLDRLIINYRIHTRHLIVMLLFSNNHSLIVELVLQFRQRKSLIKCWAIVIQVTICQVNWMLSHKLWRWIFWIKSCKCTNKLNIDLIIQALASRVLTNIRMLVTLWSRHLSFRLGLLISKILDHRQLKVTMI